MKRSDILTLICVYVYTLIHNIVTSTTYFTTVLILSNILLFNSFAVHIYYKISVTKYKHLIKIKQGLNDLSVMKYVDLMTFVNHIIYTILLINIVSSVINFFCYIIFYYGFSNSVLIIYMTSIFFLSNIVTVFKTKLLSLSDKYVFVSKCLKILNYYYNTYYVTLKLGNIMYIYLCKFSQQVWIFLKFIHTNLYNLEKQYSNNSQTAIYKNNLSNSYKQKKDYFLNRVVDTCFYYFADSRKLDNVRNFNRMETEHNGIKMFHDKNVIMDSNTTDEETLNSMDDLDDLDNIDSSDAPVVTNEQIADAEKLEKDLETEKNRKKLREKISNKRTNRGGRKIKNTQTTQNKKNIGNMMSNPLMKNMMQNMLKGDNLEKILSNMPSTNVPALNQTELQNMKNLLNNMTK